MAEPLFEFNDAWIGAMAGGLDDGDTLGILSDGLQGLGDEVARSVSATYGEELDVTVGLDEVTVWLDDDAAAEEFGTSGGAMPAQRISSGIERSRPIAERRFEEALSAHDR